MRIWTMRIVGVLNVLFAALSLTYLAGMLNIHWNRWPASATARDWAIFALLLTLSVYLVVHVAFYGIRLLKHNESAVLPCLLLYAAQTLGAMAGYWVIWLVLPQSMMNISFGLWSVALTPLDVQVLSGFTIFGVLATLFLLFTRKRIPKGQSTQPPSSTVIAAE